MFRYVQIVILAGGKSERMGFCKSNIKLNKFIALDEKINTSMNLGFFFLQ
ncbi:MAG TPA: hypothetical protein ACYCC3_00315 [Candidatus Azoamicus sp.]